MDDDEEPLYPSLDAMCAALGWSDAQKEKIHRQMEMTAPENAGDSRPTHAPTLH